MANDIVDLADLSVRQVARMIDHSLLRPELTDKDVSDGCAVAMSYQTASVCVRPHDVPFASDLLARSEVLVSTVAGFPHGGATIRAKVDETRAAIDDGAREIDMVLNIGKLRSGDLAYVEADIHAVVEAANGFPVKVILENFYLTDSEKVAGCKASERAGAALVKTSTGFAGGGATREDLVLMRASVSPQIGIKAAGGVRTLDMLVEMVQLGVTRFGVTATQTILDDLAERQLKG